MKLKLYEISGVFNQVYEMILDDDADIEMIADTLESIEFDRDKKVENTASFIKSLEADTDILKAEIDRLATKKRIKENKIDGLKKYLKGQFEVMGITKAGGNIYTVSLQNNPPSVRADENNEELKKLEYLWIKQPDKLDKKRLLEELKLGNVIVGAEIQKTKSIRIR